MDERKLHEILGQDLEVPNMVNKKLEEVYALVEQRERPGKRRRVRPLHTVKIAAAAVALLCGSAAAAYDFYVRQSVPVDPDQTVQGIVGNGQPSWTQQVVDAPDGGKPRHYPNREVVRSDTALAEGLLGAYLPESGYQWQLEDYTLTVEGYVLDESTSTAKFYYTIEHPGGFGEGAVDWTHGLLNSDVYKPYLQFETKSDVDPSFFGGRAYVDLERSTQEKLYIVESAAGFGGWKAEDGLRIRFLLQGELHEEGLRIYRDDPSLDVYLDLPGVESLPVVSAVDPVTGDTVQLSVIGLKVGCEDLDMIGCVALEYADGTRYTVYDSTSNLDNADYGLGDGESPNMVARYVFNRLVDPSQVAAVVVDGQRYEVG